MYKTVKHGENSLQYKILAQQEEGVPGVKSRKSPKAFIVKLMAIMTLLTIGIIASAFLIPLLLGNDFIAVAGTFQKFSVSTLRRSHSGNHVVVIAKKPYGWNAPHPSLSPNQTNSSQTHPDTEKSASPTQPPPVVYSPTTTTPTTPPTIPTAYTAPDPTTLRLQPHRNKLTTTETTPSSPDPTRGWLKFPPTTTIARQQSFHKDTKGELLSSKLEPVWFESVKNWRSQSSGSSVDKTNAGENWLLYLAAGFVVVLVILRVILGKFLCRKTSTEKETEQSKEDKKRLLKPSVSSDHDEE